MSFADSSAGLEPFDLLAGSDNETDQLGIPVMTHDAEDGSPYRSTRSTDVDDSDFRPRRVVRFVIESRYAVVRAACKGQFRWAECDLSQEFDFIWTDVCMSADRFSKLKPNQRYNHFAGMNSLTRKNNLGRNLLRMKKFFKAEYSFFPDTWILPIDLSDFKIQARKNRTYIVKPDNSCQGKGIFLTQNVESVAVSFDQGLVAQVYINRPFLLDGFKFDLRIYVLVSGCDPLRIYVHKEGLVRLCCTPWAGSADGSNIGDSTMHLTNYAINVKSASFRENADPDDIHDGHKRSMSRLFVYLEEQGHDVAVLTGKIDDLIVKTLIAVQPSVAHVNFSCQPEDIRNEQSFEILGFDVLLDHKLTPWLLEVNHAPSFGTDSELDRRVKLQVLEDSFKLLQISRRQRRWFKVNAKEDQSVKERAEVRFRKAVELAKARDALETRFGGFRKLYPSPAAEVKYRPFHDKAIEIWETLTGGQSRRPVRLYERTDEQIIVKKPDDISSQGGTPKRRVVIKKMKTILPVWRRKVSPPVQLLAPLSTFTLDIFLQGLPHAKNTSYSNM